MMQTAGRRIICSSNGIFSQALRLKQATPQHSLYNCRFHNAQIRNLSSSTVTVGDGGLLHHEWVVNGKLINENHNPNKDDASKTVVFLHGLLGNTKNLRTFTKKLTERNPHLSALLLDLRGHGSTTTKALQNKHAMIVHEPPHTFESCSNDILTTLSYLDLIGPDKSPFGIVGHSFGGRLALEYVHTTTLNHSKNKSSAGGSMAAIPHPPKHTWILDSVPGQAHSSVNNVIQAVSSIPLPIPSKKHLQTMLVEEKSIEPGIAAWMTTNLRPSKCKTGFEFIFDLNVATSVLEEFGKQDFLGMLRNVGGQLSSSSFQEEEEGKIHLVMAGKNTSWTNDLLQELEGIQSNHLLEKGEIVDVITGETKDSFLQMYKLPNAGHWVHVDDLEGLLQVMEKGGL